jgi:hypothetical protein
MTSSQSGPPDRRPGRWGAAAGIGLVVAIAAAGAVVFARGPVAEWLGRSWLRQHGIASGLKIRTLSLTGLTASVRLGDPADPDLTVERLEVGYAFVGPWNGAPFGVRTRSVRLVRPRLKLHLSATGLNFGALQPLITELSKRPSAGAPSSPPPDVKVEDGAVLVLTPDGQAGFRGGGELKAGALISLAGELDPFWLTLGGIRVEGGGGALQLDRRGERLIASLDLGPVKAVTGSALWRATRVSVSGEAPYPPMSGRWAGPIRASLAVRDIASSAGPTQAADGSLDADIDGALEASPTRQAIVGRLLVTGQLATFGQGAVRAGGVSGRVDLAHFALARAADQISALGDGLASAAAEQVAASGGTASVQTGPVRLTGLRLLVRRGQVSAAARLDGGLAGRGGLTPAAARALTHRVPVLSDELAYATAMERGLRAFRFATARWRAELSDHGARLVLASPLRLDASSAAHLVIEPIGAITVEPRAAKGAANLAMSGGGLPVLTARVTNGAITNAGYRADLVAEGALDALIARDARFQLEGRLSGRGGQARFDLAGCAPESANSLAFEPNPVDAVAATLCPGAGPLIAIGPAGWTAQGRLQDARGDLPGVNAQVRGAAASFRATGRGGLDTAAFDVGRSEIIDTATPLRFRSFTAAGRAELARGAWTGDFTATTPRGHRFGRLHLRQDAASGVGRAEIDTGPLVLTPSGLQPAELSPLVDFAKAVEGTAAFTGWFAWGPGRGVTSGGGLIAKAASFGSPLGPVKDASADLRFTSLSPLVTAPGQTIAVGRVEAITPVSDVTLAFKLDADALRIESASGAFARGHISLEPTTAPLAPGARVTGVLVLDKVHLGDVIAASSLADAVKLDAAVDGRIPFQLGPAGPSIQQGRLAAVGSGRLSIARKALATAGQPGLAQDLAYQAMENLAFDQMDASLNSLPGERLGVLFHIKGRHDPPQRQRATIAVGDLVRGQALAKPLTLPSDTQIDLTLDTSLNFGELVRALEQAWRDSTAPSGDQRGGSAAVQAGTGSLAPR